MLKIDPPELNQKTKKTWKIHWYNTSFLAFIKIF